MAVPVATHLNSPAFAAEPFLPDAPAPAPANAAEPFLPGAPASASASAPAPEQPQATLTLAINGAPLAPIPLRILDPDSLPGQRFAALLAQGPGGLKSRLARHASITRIEDDHYLLSDGIPRLSYTAGDLDLTSSSNSNLLPPLPGGDSATPLVPYLLLPSSSSSSSSSPSSHSSSSPSPSSTTVEYTGRSRSRSRSRKHDRAGLVSLVVRDNEDRPETTTLVAQGGKLVNVTTVGGPPLPNGTGLVITLGPAPELDGRCVKD